MDRENVRPHFTASLRDVTDIMKMSVNGVGFVVTAAEPDHPLSSLIFIADDVVARNHPIQRAIECFDFRVAKVTSLRLDELVAEHAFAHRLHSRPGAPVGPIVDAGRLNFPFQQSQDELLIGAGLTVFRVLTGLLVADDLVDNRCRDAADLGGLKA